MAHIGLSAGGTGGHLFPAIAVARQLRSRGHRVSLLCDQRIDRFDDEGLFDHVEKFAIASPSSGALFKKIFRLFGIGLATLKARRRINHLGIDAVIGFGGYTTVAALLGAHLLKKPIIVHEGNAVLGRANRLLARFASHIATHFETTKYLKRYEVATSVTGMPVREAVRLHKHALTSSSAPGTLNILIFGGSLGARFFSDFAPELFTLLTPQERANIKLVQQCRQEDMDRVHDAYFNMDAQWAAKVTLAPFYTDIAQHIAQADLIVCRAGASTVAELATIGRAGFYVPLPGSLDQEQAHNAQIMVDAQAGFMAQQKKLKPEQLVRIIRHGLKDKTQLREMGHKARLIGREQAVNQVADCIEAQLTIA